MRILVYKWKAYNYVDVLEAMSSLSVEITVIEQELKSYDEDEEFEIRLQTILEESAYDAVFTMNYFAVISEVCHRCKTPYLAWTCDNPLISMYHNSVFYPENYIFTFDKTNYLEFLGMGVEHIWYLPLAGNVSRLDYLLDHAKDLDSYCNDIAFVGSLYEINTYDRIKNSLSEYLQGYFEAAMWAQRCISGGNILDEMLSVPILEQLQEKFKLEKSKNSFSDLALVFSTTVLGFKTAALERKENLLELAKRYPVTLYSNSDTKDLLRVRYGGSLDYWSEMPKVFCSTKINLNFTIPNIKSGLPQRIWDVLSCRGFLMTNFQAEIPCYFNIGEDLVCFESKEELSEKVGYYLANEEEREAIAKRGYEKVKKHHTYMERVKQMLLHIQSKSSKVIS